jgi:subtilisin family serine protease
MQRLFNDTLTRVIFVLLASFGGGVSADPADPSEQPQATSATKSRHSAASGQAGPRLARSGYIVQLSEPPVAAYDGGIRGHAATRPARGSKLDADDPNVINYRGHLTTRQDAVLNSVGGARKLHDYTYVFNGFAAELTEAQAAKLAGMPGVLAVTKDELRSLDTSSTPTFLGLTGKDGFWKENHAKGEDVIIGIVDGGIWPEHPSFSDRKHLDRDAKKGDDDDEEKLAYKRIRGWKGTCVAGEEFETSDCNRKLIGARYYNAGFGGNDGIDTNYPWEYNSPRDYGGHGTHTASTAGGNADVPATGPAAAFGKISGIAPRARIAAYKVCWQTPAGGSCATSDSVKAIDQAIADGVDVINFSISGTTTNFRDPVEQAFLRAADAGVFVAASAGNSGPAASTVAHPSPWITTVAAGTHNRNGAGSTTLGDSTSYAGSSFATALASSPLVDAPNVGAIGVGTSFVELCYPGALDPASVAGKIVLCKRGTIALVDKSRAVFEAGGAGMLLYNDPAGATNTLALIHSVPTVHVVAASGAAIKSYIATAGTAATASIAQATLVYDVPAPLTASFSSRGPSLAAGANLLKPDLIAPGQDILAGVAPPGNSGRLFDLYSGTSMSSPHVAGLAALMKEVHPKWSPMAIKSALMTSAGDVLDGPNTNPLVIFRQGAGHVQPNNAADPGLVFDSDTTDWLGFLCGVSQPVVDCAAAGIPVLNPSNLNMASIAIGALAGVQTVTRRVTNVSEGHSTYTASVAGMTGFDVKVTPASLTIERGKTKSFTVTFTRTNAALNAYTGGQLTLVGGTSKKKSVQHEVRVPIVVRPVALAAPTQVGGSYNVTFGYNGAFSATARGLVPAIANTGTIATGDFIRVATITIPAGTTHARFSLFDADVAPGSDIDLYVYNAATSALVGASGGGTSAEEVNLLNPAAGTYWVYLDGFSIPGVGTSFTQFSWVLGSTAAGNMTVTPPAAATTGQTGTIGISTPGLEARTKYFGSVVYGGTTNLPAPTIVRIDTP